MPRQKSLAKAKYHPSINSLYLARRSGILRLAVEPVRADAMQVDDASLTWQCCFPVIQLDKMLRLIDGVAMLDDPSNVNIGEDSWRIPKERIVETADAYRQFVDGIGRPLCERTARFGALHFAFLYFSSREPALLQLAESNAGLAFAVALHATQQERESGNGTEVIRRLLGRRERNIASELGFVDNSWRILKRVCPEGLTPRRLGRLRRALTDPRIRRVAAHLPRIGPSNVELLRPELMGLIDNRVFHQIAEREWPDARRATIADRFLAIFRMLRRWVPDVQIHAESLEHIGRLCDRYERLLEPADVRSLQSVIRTEFPPPPVEGTEFRIPLRTPGLLLQESLTQNNCVFNYIWDVVTCQRYFYRVLPSFGRPHITLEIVRESEEFVNRWRIGRVETVSGKMAPRETILQLARWLAAKQSIDDDRLVLPEAFQAEDLDGVRMLFV